MAASDNVSDRILSNIDEATITYIDGTFANLWGAISVSFRNILVLWIILYGLAIWRGLIKTPVQDIAGAKASQYIRRGGKLAGHGIRSGATRGWSAVKNRFNRRTHGRQKIAFTPVERR